MTRKPNDVIANSPDAYVLLFLTYSDDKAHWQECNFQWDVVRTGCLEVLASITFQNCTEGGEREVKIGHQSYSYSHLPTTNPITYQKQNVCVLIQK